MREGKIWGWEAFTFLQVKEISLEEDLEPKKK